MDNMYDDRLGDIWFDEEDPTSEFYKPECCRNVYYDLAIGVFDYDADSEYEDYEDYEDYEEYEEYYYNESEEFDDY
jgi:hypothetical protein